MGLAMMRLRRMEMACLFNCLKRGEGMSEGLCRNVLTD